MKKVTISAVLAIVFLVSSIAQAGGETSLSQVPQPTEVALNSTVNLPGRLYVAFSFQGAQVKVEAMRREGKIYLPIRETVEKLGGRVFWYGEEERQICFLAGESKVFLDLREEVFLRNGQALTVREQDIFMQDGRAYVPVENIIDMLQLR